MLLVAQANYITIRQGTPGGAVLGFGFAPISVVCTASGPLYLHYNTTAGCGTDGSCHTGTVQCTSCAGAADPCTSIGTVSCGTPATATVTGTGLWSPGSCGFSTPGNEKIYSFTAPSTGTYSLQVTSTNSGGFIDYFYKAASGGCNATGWTCIDDIFSPVTATIGTLTAGTTYYFLLDAETTSSVTQTFQIICPAVFDPCASIQTLTCGTPATATSTGSGVWSPSSCGFSTPGVEKVYSFTAPTTGAYNLQVTSTNSGGYIDYFFKAASGGCSATGWTCIDDVFSPATATMGTLTAGTTYYILLDPETTSSVTQTFQIDCPAAGAAPACIASPSAPANGSNAGCPNSSQLLSWPAAATATGYDVYFGTNPTPPFVATTASLSYNTGTLAAGTYYWQIRPLNTFGTASGCTTWSFTKADVTAPTITCAASVTTNNSPATACSAVVTYGSISSTDDCIAPSITLLSGLASGSTFPVGITTIVYRAADASNNSATCSFTVTVNDATLPNITCPANIVKNNDAGLCGANTTYATPIATDNCGLAVGSPSLVSGQLSGTFFAVGITTNTWQAKDLSNNTRTCSFTVTVNDTEKPKITCPADILVGNDLGDCSADLPYLGTPIISDNCALLLLTNNSPGTFQLGSTTVTWIINDNHSNTASCVQNVTIEDREFPVVACPSNINVKTDEGDCIATVGYSANATDNCAGLVLEYSISPMSTFEIGYSNVEVTATDGAGNSVGCYFQISVSRRLEICNDFDDDCDGLTDESEDWVKIAKQYGADTDDLDEYGISVDIDGDYAIVGSNQKNAGGQNVGAAYILFRDKNGANAWGQIAKLDAPDLQTGDNFGASVSISGGVAAVGSPQDDNQIGNEGSISIFYQSSSNPAVWTYQKKITVFDADSGDNLGTSVALDGDRLVAGANLSDDSNTNAGAAYIFYRNQGGADNWGEVAKLLASTGDANDNFGVSVAIDGDYAVIGANGVDGFLQDVGAAYVFGRNQFGPDAWGQVAKIEANTPGQNDNFGGSVAISGPWVLVGADRNDQKGLDAGIAYAFYQNNNGISNSWGQRNILQDFNGKAGDRYGSSVAIDGEYAVVGAKGVDDFAGDDAGAGFVYLRLDNGWGLVGNLEDGAGQTGDGLGSCAALSGRTAILGAPLDDAPGNNQGSALVFGGLCQTEGRPDSRDNPSAASVASLQCFPVPFSSVLNIEVKGIMATDAQVVVLNTLGQTVATLYNGAMEGDMTFHWRPSQAAAGVYFLRVTAAGKILTQTIVLER